MSIAACAAESAVAGKWSCTNVPDGGPQSPWTLVVREDGAKLAGVLTDGQVEVPLAEIRTAESRLIFGFDINGKPYRFEGKVDGKALAGRYSGAEAAGKLVCTRP